MIKKLIHTFLIGFLAVSFSACSSALGIFASSGGGPAPLTVSFSPTGAATGTLSTTYHWSFGSGEDVFGEDQVHIFEEPGTYTVILEVTSRYRTYTHSDQATVEIVVTDPNEEPTDSTPSVSISALPSSGTADLLVQFSSSVVGGDAPLTYAWTFGDGETSTQANPSHTYSVGTHTATLTVTDLDGDSDSDSDEIIVTEQAEAEDLTVSITPESPEWAVGNPLGFTSNVSGGTPPYTYSWTFGDGQFSTEDDPTITYPTAGEWVVNLSVTDDNSTTENATPTTIMVSD